jgi:hypothetical protein
MDARGTEQDTPTKEGRKDQPRMDAKGREVPRPKGPFHTSPGQSAATPWVCVSRQPQAQNGRPSGERPLLFLPRNNAENATGKGDAKEAFQRGNPDPLAPRERDRVRGKGMSNLHSGKATNGTLPQGADRVPGCLTHPPTLRATARPRRSFRAEAGRSQRPPRGTNDRADQPRKSAEVAKKGER